MSDPQPTPSWLFNLEGTFLGFFGHPLDRPMSIVLEVEQEQIVLKLSQALSASMRQSHPQPGDRIRCVGQSQIDSLAGVIKLNAHQLFPLPLDSDPKPAGLPASPVCQPRAKVLVCHKSGCQKRGGRQMVAVLEKTLRDLQLQDRVEIQYTGCQKRCAEAPNLTIMPGKHRYDRLSPESIPTLIKEHFCPSEQRLVPGHADS